jgi:hypothetical protein
MRAGWLILGLLAALPAFAQDTKARPLAEYARFELRDIQAKVEVHPKVMNKLTTELKLRIDPALERWNADGAQPGHAGTLAIETVITDMKFVSGGKRFWAGAFAGGSHSAAEVRLVDVETGQVVESEKFEHKASAMSGSMSIGAADNAMLDRLAQSVATWVIARHDGAAAPSAEATAK